MEIASQFRRHAQDGKKIIGDARCADALCFNFASGARQIRIVAAEESKISETALAGAPIKIIRQANRTGIENVCALTNEHQPVRLRIAQRPQTYSVNHTEDGSIAADAERESQYRNGSKRRLLRQHSQRVAQILPQRLHFVTP